MRNGNYIPKSVLLVKGIKGLNTYYIPDKGSTVGNRG